MAILVRPSAGTCTCGPLLLLVDHSILGLGAESGQRVSSSLANRATRQIGQRVLNFPLVGIYKLAAEHLVDYFGVSRCRCRSVRAGVDQRVPHGTVV